MRAVFYTVKRFSYSPYTLDIKDNAVKLGEFINKIDAPAISLVGHSLGGLVILKYALDTTDARIKRIVNLATPHSGSVFAKRISNLPLGKYVLGKSLMSANENGITFPEKYEIGAIAGKLNMILGWLLFLPRPNDTIVATCEVQHPKLKDYIDYYVTHASMLLSRKVSQQIIHFLEYGVFRREANERNA